MRTSVTDTIIIRISTSAPGPRQPVPLVVGRDGVHIDLQRQRRNRLIQLEAPELVAERGKQQRRRLARHPRKRQHTSRNDSRRGRAQAHRDHRPPLRHAQAQRSLADRVRHRHQHLLGRPRNRRHHHDGQRNPAGERRKMHLAHHNQRVGSNPHHNRRNPIQHVRGETHRHRQQLALPILGQIDARRDAHRNPHRTGQRENNSRTQHGVGHASARLAHRRGNVGEERQVQRARALVEQVGKDRHQRHNHQHRAQHCKPRHQMVHQHSAMPSSTACPCV